MPLERKPNQPPNPREKKVAKDAAQAMGRAKLPAKKIKDQKAKIINLEKCVELAPGLFTQAQPVPL